MKDDFYLDENPAQKIQSPTPITLAIGELGKRCVIKNGSYWVDNYPVTMFTLIEKANELRRNRGDKPLKLSKYQ